MRVPWTTRRSNQSILKEIAPVCSLEGIMLKLKLQYFGHLMQRVNSLEKTLMLGGIGGRDRIGNCLWLVLCVNSGDGAWNSVGGRKRVTAGIIMIVTTIVREVLPPARCAPCRGTASSEAACIQG